MRLRGRRCRHGVLDTAVHDVRTGRFERTLSALTAAGAAVTAGEIYLSHDGASFGNKMMWWPIVGRPDRDPGRHRGGVLPPRGAHRAAAGRRRRSSPTGCRAPTCTGAASPSVPAGSPDTTWKPGRRCSRRCWPRWSAAWGCWRPSCAASGPPTAGRRPDALPQPRSAGRHTAGPRPVPRLRRPRQRRRLGRRHRRASCWRGSHRPSELAFFTPHEVGIAAPLLDLLLAQDGDPRVPVLALIDAAAGRRRDRRLALRRPARGRAGLAGQPRRPRRGRPRQRMPGAVSRSSTAPSRPRWSRRVQDLPTTASSGTTGRPSTSGACGRATPAPRSTPIPGRGTRSASRARLPARLPQPRRRRARAVGGRRPARRRSGAVRRPRRAGARASTHDCIGADDGDDVGMERSDYRDIRARNESAWLHAQRRHPDRTTGCAPTCAATPTATRSTSSSSAPARAAACSPSGWPGPAGGSCAWTPGPFWDPDTDWVSPTNAAPHTLYWTEPRQIGGSDPVPLGSNNSGRGVGGSMVHYAGYTPRFHPSDFRHVQPRRRRRGLADRLRRPAAVLRGDRAGTAGRRRGLAVGRPAQLPAPSASGQRQR